MNSRKKQLKNSRLCVIIDKETRTVLSKKILAQVSSKAGAGIIQLRDKISDKNEILQEAFNIKKALRPKTLFIINDFLDIAKISDSDGVHLGQIDSSPVIARRILGINKIIGKSCHTVKQAVIAQKQGADYIGVGPIFSTPTKPGLKPIGLERLKEISDSVKIPVFAIGGINQINLKSIIRSGTNRVAVIRAVCKAKNIPDTIRAFLKELS